MSKKKRVLVAVSMMFTIGCGTWPVFASDISERKPKRTYDTYHTKGGRGENSSQLSSNTRQRTTSRITRISTQNDHITCLRDGISSARRSILITSYGVSDEAFVQGNLYPLLSGATERGVKVYIYNIDSKDIDSNVARFFERYNIAYDVAFTHAKLFAVDRCPPHHFRNRSRRLLSDGYYRIANYDSILDLPTAMELNPYTLFLINIKRHFPMYFLLPANCRNQS